ncbi:MAG TPA: circularly permuted type 2 ATP-grasp protein [Polyangiaceae bacterium]
MRVPSGVSYLLENRAITKRVFPELFRNACVGSPPTWVRRTF